MKIFPHEQLKEDFESILQDATRQDDFGNSGENSFAKGIKSYFIEKIIPLYKTNSDFARIVDKIIEEDFISLLINSQLISEEVSRHQENLLSMKTKIKTFLADHGYFGQNEIRLKKLTDFKQFLGLIESDTEDYKIANDILEECIEIEELYFPIIIRSISNIYAKILPSLFWIIKIQCKIEKDPKYDVSKIQKSDISEALDWIENNISSSHGLFPILGNVRNTYRVIRNNADHPENFIFHGEESTIEFVDLIESQIFDIDEFSRIYRFLVYFVEIFTRGLLWIYCDSKRSPLANELFKKYNRQLSSEPSIEYQMY